MHLACRPSLTQLSPHCHPAQLALLPCTGLAAPLLHGVCQSSAPPPLVSVPLGGWSLCTSTAQATFPREWSCLRTGWG